MKKLQKGETITLDTGKKYFVAEIVELDNKEYLYLVNNDEVEVVIGESIVENNEFIVETITDRELMFKIIKIVFKRLSNEIEIPE